MSAAFEGSIIKYEWGGKRLDLSGKKKMLEEIIHSSQVKTELDHFIATDDRFQLFFNVSKLNWERMISTGAERMEKTLNDVAPNNETHKVVLKIKRLELRIVLKYSPERADLFKPDTVRSGKAASTVDREVSRLFRECVHPDAIISVETQRFTRPRGMLRYRMTARAYMTVNRDKLAIGDDELFPLVPEMWFQHKILLHLVQTQNPLIDSIGVRGITLCGYLYNAGAPMLFKLHERAKVQEKFKVNVRS
ncbi:unnamed protein product [Calicophoron daubneyi]|uniref:VTC domain-containing protein n=1 Tax=Calicophoron daubneyi TaxID=300641 RepID=A0AAV2TEN4_CALDB